MLIKAITFKGYFYPYRTFQNYGSLMFFKLILFVEYDKSIYSPSFVYFLLFTCLLPEVRQCYLTTSCRGIVKKNDITVPNQNSEKFCLALQLSLYLPGYLKTICVIPRRETQGDSKSLIGRNLPRKADETRSGHFCTVRNKLLYVKPMRFGGLFCFCSTT